ncbi:MAG: VWA domain-containing protein, partial [Deltaproteobacteria bacterium]
RLVSVDGRILPLRRVDIAVDACAGLARVRVRHHFENPTADPLRVTWQVPLPVDAAVSGYAFELADRRVEGVVERREAARQRFEEALVEGRTAALLEEERSSLFTQEVGNVPPHSEVVCELLLDQRLQWRPRGAWQWRFPTTVAPRYLGDSARVADEDRVTVDVADHDTGARLHLDLDLRDPTTGPVTSSSHPLRSDAGHHHLASPEGAPLDRDVVVTWPVAAPAPGLALDLARAEPARGISRWTHGLLCLVPPSVPPATVARDLVVLLDTSGSMAGAPLAQAAAVTRALIESLGDTDTIEMIEFSNRPRRWRSRPVAATADNRQAAIAWVDRLRAGGGTEMRDGILAALATVRDEARRQIILVTDGLIGFEAEIIGEIARNLPRGSRVHTLGIGSSVNRTLTAGAARAGGGVEAVIGLDEDPTTAAATLVAHTARPLVVDLRLSGDALIDTALHRLPDLMAGAPVRIPLRLRPEGGRLRVEGHTPDGSWSQQVVVPAVPPGSGSPAVITLYGRAAVDTTELEEAHIGRPADEQVEQLGLDYRIVTRRTSWIAVSETRTVDPGAPSRRETVPQLLPHGTDALGFGLRPCRGIPSPPVSAPAAAPPRRRLPASAPPPPSARRTRLFEQRSTMLRALTVLRGRLARLAGGQWVLEITVDRPLSWDPGEAVTGLLRGDLEVPLRALLDRSTGACEATPGQVLRLVLDPPPEAVAVEDLQVLTITSGERSLAVRVVEVEGV